MKSRRLKEIHYVEKEQPDTINMWEHLWRLPAIIGVFLVSFVVLGAWLPEFYDWMDAVHPLVQLWAWLMILVSFVMWVFFIRKK